MGIFSPMIIYCLDLIKIYVGNKYFFGGKMKRLWAAAAGGTGLLIMLLIFPFTESGRYVFTYAVAMVTVGIMVEARIRTKVLRLLWLYCISAFLEETMRIIYKEFIINEEIIHIIVAISALITIAIGAYVFNRIRIKFSNRKIVFSVIYTSLVLICLSTGFSVATIQFMFELLPEEMELINLDYVAVIAFLAIVLLLVLILYIQKIFEFLEKAAQTERNLKQIQAAYYQSLLDKEVETRRYRHDMHNHLLYIRESAKAENARRTADYVESLEKKWNRVSSNHYETGNMTLNILLNHYLTDLDGARISVVGLCSRELKIDETDFCTIFSNLIQNAVEELKKQKGMDCFFSIEIKQGRDNTRVIIRNSTRVPLQSNQVPRSSKQDKKSHGIGLKNVKDTVEKYGGEFSWSADGKEFRAIVTMKI